jgi:hypothetical protein
MAQPKDRSISIGGNVSGSVVIAGDENTLENVTVGASPPPSDQAAVLQALEELRALLVEIAGRDSRRVGNAIDEAIDEAKDPEPRKSVIAESLKRALEVASGATAFLEQVGKLRPSVEALVRWLGPSFAGMLKSVGL